jgi:hypothetical protein
MELHISMIPSPEDPSWRSDDYQSELRNLGLILRADGLELHDVGAHTAREGCTPAMSGVWKVKLGATLGPILVAPVCRRGVVARFA